MKTDREHLIWEKKEERMKKFNGGDFTPNGSLIQGIYCVPIVNQEANGLWCVRPREASLVIMCRDYRYSNKPMTEISILTQIDGSGLGDRSYLAYCRCNK